MTDENANTADLTMNEKLDRILAELSDMNSYNTVLRWLRKGLVPGAVSQTLGNETRWFIPNERVADFRKWDPKKRWGKRGPGKKAAKKGARAK